MRDSLPLRKTKKFESLPTAQYISIFNVINVTKSKSPAIIHINDKIRLVCVLALIFVNLFTFQQTTHFTQVIGEIKFYFALFCGTNAMFPAVRPASFSGAQIQILAFVYSGLCTELESYPSTNWTHSQGFGDSAKLPHMHLQVWESIITVLPAPSNLGLIHLFELIIYFTFEARVSSKVIWVCVYRRCSSVSFFSSEQRSLLISNSLSISSISFSRAFRWLTNSLRLIYFLSSSSSSRAHFCVVERVLIVPLSPNF